ncbi:MAG: hypothetical protein HY735_15650 [Verrucomicrobia bacterium]|nr:hypothetical protein [Verrucomicrobiota bacterium]
MLALFLGCAAQKAPAKSSKKKPVAQAQRLRNGIETFDAAWRIIYDSHFDTNFNGVDWVAVRDELRPKAKEATTVGELRKIIEQMLGRLGQSHMGLIPGSVADAFDPEKVREALASAVRAFSNPSRTNQQSALRTEEPDDWDAGGSQEGEVGLDVRLIDSRILVTRVDADGSAQVAGVRPGWIIESIDHERLSDRLKKLPPSLESGKARFLAWRMVRSLLQGRPGTKVQIECSNEANKPVELTLERQRAKGIPAKLGLLPPLRAHLESELLKSPSGARIGLIRFNLFMIPIASRFDQAIDEFRGADGIVIDLRGNPGGIGGMVMGFAGHFLRERVSLGTMKMRGNEIKFNANPRWVNPRGLRVEPFAGPVAILIDGVSLSAAEIFAGGMQDIGRARVFGETSPGQALPALWDRLPNGDVLYHAFADYLTGSGTRLEGRGVIPDQPVRITREDLLAGRDEPLLAALNWISEQRESGPKPRSSASRP